MESAVKNFRILEQGNGKTHIRVFAQPQWIEGREGLIDLQAEYADVANMRYHLNEELDEIQQRKQQEWRDLVRYFGLSKANGCEIIFDTDTLDINTIDVKGRDKYVRRAESEPIVLPEKLPERRTSAVRASYRVEGSVNGVVSASGKVVGWATLLDVSEPLIKYPREVIWVDGAEDISGVIILPYDDYSRVYVLEGDRENPTVRFIDDKETAQGIRPYYEKPGDGKTYIYVDHFSGGGGTQDNPYLIHLPIVLTLPVTNIRKEE